jgi:hypothetical protein
MHFFASRSARTVKNQARWPEKKERLSSGQGDPKIWFNGSGKPAGQSGKVVHLKKPH